MKPEQPRWLDQPRNVTRLVWTLGGLCLVLLLADLLVHKHNHFDWEGWFGFYGLFGFAAFVFVVFVGTLLRRIVMRDEDYYDR